MKNKEKTSVFEIISTIIKIICIIVLILLIAVLLLQRMSNNAQAVAGIRLFNVATESMVPEYVVGDIIVVKETDSEELKVGDDVTYLGEEGTFQGRVVTHRIVQIEDTENGKVIHTKGIANEVEDPTITVDQIYGKVIYKCVLISMLSKLINNMTVFYIVVFIPLALLIFLQIKDSISSKYEKDDEDDDDDDDEE